MDQEFTEKTELERWPRGLFKVTKILLLTTRRIGLKTIRFGKEEHYMFAPSLENLRAINACIDNSWNGTCYFCLPEPEELFTFSGTDQECCEVLELLEQGNKEADDALSQLYLARKGKLVIREVLMPDGYKIGLVDYIENPLDNLRGEKNE
jgi:hypothetical protein